MTHGFCWYELRTTDVGAARRFYASVLDPGGAAQPCPGDRRCERRLHGELTQLPERAAAQGAPAHWLGHIGVADVDEAARRLVARGAVQLGPTRRAAARPASAILRDPLGAIVALSERPVPATATGIHWHELYSQDPEREAAIYGELFGLQKTQVLELGGEFGAYQMFRWDSAGPSRGGMLSIARLPHVHPQWLYYFGVDNVLDAGDATDNPIMPRSFYGGVTLMVGFWLAIGEVATPLSAWLAFASSYAAIVIVEPVFTLLVLHAIARRQHSAAVRFCFQPQAV